MNNIKKWGIITIVIILISAILVMLIFGKELFKVDKSSETHKLMELSIYKENVKTSKIDRIAILSQSVNFVTEEKEDIEKILNFLESIEGTSDNSEIGNLTSNSYGIVLYYNDDTNTVITIMPDKFAIDNSAYYKNKSAYYTTLKKLLEELQ